MAAHKDMKIVTKLFLLVVLVSAFALGITLLRGPLERETWATLTGVLAVIAAVIASLPSLRVLELQEDATRPCPLPYFDITSRYGLLQLRVKNVGASVAYDVRLNWNDQPKNKNGEAITALVSILAQADQ